jgi:hypothetical protein
MTMFSSSAGRRASMTTWRLEETDHQLRLARVARRSLGSPAFTWADLLHRQLSAAQVYVIYCPSRFNLPVDAVVKHALEAFGAQTGPGTSVNYWDPRDPEFSQALAFFDLKAPPALLLTRGRQRSDRAQLDSKLPDLANSDLYTVILTDPGTLEDLVQLAAAVNVAHEVLMRADPKEITRYLRERAVKQLLAVLGRAGSDIRDEMLKFKPRFQLPGGIAIQVGG